MNGVRYSIRLLRGAEKDLRSLRNLESPMRSALRRLEEAPLRGHRLEGELYDVRSLAVSLGGVAYRAAYLLDRQSRTCVVILIGPHEGFYDRAVRRVASLGWRRRVVRER